MATNIVPPNQPQSPFDSIRRHDADGNEHWLARELQKVLGYLKWQRFEEAIERAKISAKIQGVDVAKHLTASGKLSSASDPVPLQDYKLSRFFCYLIAMNGDPRKDEIAQAQGYFVAKTRESELLGTQQLHLAPVPSLPQRDAIEYINASATLATLPDSRLKRLLGARLVAELSIDIVNQKQIALTEPVKNYTTATVRAAMLGYSTSQVGNGSSLGKFIKAEITPAFSDWQGQYSVAHYEVCVKLDSRIHAYFLTRSL